MSKKDIRHLYVCTAPQTDANGNEIDYLIGILTRINDLYYFEYKIENAPNPAKLMIPMFPDETRLYKGEEARLLLDDFLPSEIDTAFVQEILKANDMTEYDEWTWLTCFDPDDPSVEIRLRETLSKNTVIYSDDADIDRPDDENEGFKSNIVDDEDADNLDIDDLFEESDDSENEDDDYNDFFTEDDDYEYDYDYVAYDEEYETTDMTANVLGMFGETADETPNKFDDNTNDFDDWTDDIDFTDNDDDAERFDPEERFSEYRDSGDDYRDYDDDDEYDEEEEYDDDLPPVDIDLSMLNTSHSADNIIEEEPPANHTSHTLSIAVKGSNIRSKHMQSLEDFIAPPPESPIAAMQLRLQETSAARYEKLKKDLYKRNQNY